MGLPVVQSVGRETGSAPVGADFLPTWLRAVEEPAEDMEASGTRVVDGADEALFARVAGGDAEAFAAFYDRHAGLLYGVALKVLLSETDAEDVLQDAAVLIWERAPDYRAELGRPLSWAVTLVRNKAIDRLRSLKRRSHLLERVAGEATEVAPELADRAALASEQSAAVARTLGSLPPDQRRAIELAFFGGLSQSEIAEHLTEPLGTIKARIRRGMLAMRDALEGAL